MNRVIVSGPSSGSGKTTFTCGLLAALKIMGIDAAAFKSGPDYIDPMFHRQIIGSRSGNLDLFFSTEEQIKRIFLKKAGDFSVIEGAMGYYDGIGGTEQASAYHLAKTLQTPVLLVANPRGMALSCGAMLKGMKEFRQDSRIEGVVFNNCSEAVYRMVKPIVEGECGIGVFGFLPKAPECAIESRHLGLVTAMEIEDLQKKVRRLGQLVLDHVDMDKILALGKGAPALKGEATPLSRREKGPVVAVAKDRAFCFYYEENLDLLREYGCTLQFFSPLRDQALPENTGGLYLGGGYPELYAKALSQNKAMRQAVWQAAQKGMPIIGECGGFMYLSKAIDGQPMAGVFNGQCGDTGKLGRFGYAEIRAKEDGVFLRQGESIKAHEFHYWDSDECGEVCQAVKPVTGKKWDCVEVYQNTWAGFPHLYFESNPKFAERFVNLAERYANGQI